MQTGKITALYARFLMTTGLTRKAEALSIRKHCLKIMRNPMVLRIFPIMQMTDIQVQISTDQIFSV